jgi:hypothetical protein
VHTTSSKKNMEPLAPAPLAPIVRADDQELVGHHEDETHPTLSCAAYVGTWNCPPEECATPALRAAALAKMVAVLGSFTDARGRVQMECGAAGNYHGQWTLQLPKKLLARTLRKALDARQVAAGLAMKTWFQRRKGTELQAVEYCCKEDTRVMEEGQPKDLHTAWLGGLTMAKCTKGVRTPNGQEQGGHTPAS